MGAKLLSAHTKSVILFDDYIISYDGMIIIILDFDISLLLSLLVSIHEFVPLPAIIRGLRAVTHSEWNRDCIE